MVLNVELISRFILFFHVLFCHPTIAVSIAKLACTVYIILAP